MLYLKKQNNYYYFIIIIIITIIILKNKWLPCSRTQFFV